MLIENLEKSGLDIDFVLLCETFLNDMNEDMFSITGYNFVCKNREKGKGGGVAIYIKSS
jgi:hypothetical protein